jgi:hypothetical protein
MLWIAVPAARGGCEIDRHRGVAAPTTTRAAGAEDDAIRQRRVAGRDRHVGREPAAERNREIDGFDALFRTQDQGALLRPIRYVRRSTLHLAGRRLRRPLRPRRAPASAGRQPCERASSAPVPPD